MTAERVVDVPAYILQKRPYRETSLLIEALTAQYGRVGLVARGARGGGKRRGGGIDLLQRYRMQWQRRGELATLQSIEADAAPQRLVGERVLWVWYANELLLRALARDDPHPELFDAYEALLTGLEQVPRTKGAPDAGDAAAEPLLRSFEWRLLCALGYQPSPPAMPSDSTQPYGYDATQGVHPHPKGTLSADGLQAALSGRFDSKEARTAGRAVFRAHLPELVGSQPLRTPAMLRRLRASQSDPQ